MMQLEGATLHLPLLCPQLNLSVTQLENLIESVSLKIWHQLRKNLGLQALSILFPLFKNHTFKPLCLQTLNHRPNIQNLAK